MIDRSLARVVALWVVITVAVRALWLAHVPPVATWDGAIYARTALRIARGMGFVDTWNNLPPFKPTAFYPVGYPALLGFGHMLAGPTPWVAGALNVISAAVTVACVVWLARRAYDRMACVHVAAALYAFSPGLIAYTSAFMTETVSGAVLALAVVAAALHARSGSRLAAVAMGLLLGGGGLIRPQALLLAPLFAWVAAPSRTWRARATTMFLVGVATCAVVLPWTARNCRKLDGCALVSVNGGSNLWIGADPRAEGGYRDLRPGEGCDRVHGEVAKDRCYGALAMRRIRENPWGWASLVPAKLRVTLDYEYTPASYLVSAGALPNERLDTFARRCTAWHRLMCALALLALMAYFPRRGMTREAGLSLAAVLGNLAVHAIFFGVDRYHFLFAPFVAVLAGGVVASLRSPRAVAAPAA